nr:MAG TPA: hypothetical protein [Caudoviricetes sp.]
MRFKNGDTFTLFGNCVCLGCAMCAILTGREG